MSKYIFTLLVPIMFIVLNACNSSVLASSSKYLDYVEQKGVYINVSDLNVASIYPLSKVPTKDGILSQKNVLRSIDEVDFTEVTVVTTIPEVLNQINANDIKNLTATAPDEIVSSVNPPNTAWTEIEYIKTMYTNTPCTSYRYALYSSYQTTYYDVGCAINVIGITSTGFYRLNNDRYIPCEYLTENDIQEPLATSRAVVYYD
ncbi:MAG: hypothetical protein LIO71_07170 [Ruminococcus sp.]|nr:hypothetical protein [Ruminococcus sp.]